METPYRVNEDTYVISSWGPFLGFGVLAINWFFIRAREPVLIDTGMPVEREQYLKTLWELVDPEDLRWIFLTHDDNDHAGNLRQVMEAAPNARLVTSFIALMRMSDVWQVPLDRVLLVNPGQPGQTFSAGDRQLTVVRPPVFDSPATQGLYDGKTEILFPADSFGAIIPSPTQDVAEVKESTYTDGFYIFNRINHPWSTTVADPNKFNRVLEGLRQLQPRSILSSHAPPAHGRTDALIKTMSALPTMEPFVGPDLQALESMIGNLEAGWGWQPG